jgi:hypothetical protein
MFIPYDEIKTVLAVNAKEYQSIGELDGREILMKNNRFFMFSRLAGRMLPVSKKKLGML